MNLSKSKGHTFMDVYMLIFGVGFLIFGVFMFINEPFGKVSLFTLGLGVVVLASSGILFKKDNKSDAQNDVDTQKKLDEANRKFEESGMQAEMRNLFASGIPEKIFNKSISLTYFSMAKIV